MFTLSTRRPADRRARLRLETVEDRAVPAAFADYGSPYGTPTGTVAAALPADGMHPPVEGQVLLGTPTGSIYQSISVVTPLTPHNTDADPDLETVTFTFQDNDSTPTTVHLLVYRKMDDSVPSPIDKTKQVLVTDVSITTDANAPGKQYTLTANLPACAFQVDAMVGPLSMLPGEPIGYTSAYNNLLDGALGANDCPGDTEGGPDQGITRTQGYWKNHSDAWPVDSLTLGTVSYTKAELLTILNTPVRGNGAIALAHQLIAAKLNIAAGADPFASTVAQINAADALLGSGDLRLGFTLPTSQTSTLTGQLDAFNQSGDV